MTTPVPPEVVDAFHRYEAALVSDDLDELARWFWPDATRFGTDGNQRGGAAIDAARRRPHPPLHRSLTSTSLRVLADGVVLTEVEFRRTGGGPGRQTQVWQRRGDRWAIVHAHVSLHPSPGTA